MSTKYAAATDHVAVPVRCLTPPDRPGHHWFGYYDKLQFGPDDRELLGMRVAEEYDQLTGSDDQAVEIGVIDLENDDAWTTVGTSRAWCWQQGCMLQYIPHHGRKIIWNDRAGDRFVARILDLDTGVRRDLPRAIYALSPCGTFAIATDFARLNHTRPGYGYPGVTDLHRDDPAPADSGIWRIDLETGEERLIFSIADATAIPWPGAGDCHNYYWFNHLLVAPGGQHFVFLHRQWQRDPRRLTTRMMVADADGQNVRVLAETNNLSHFIWQDADHMLAWCNALGRNELTLINIHTLEATPFPGDHAPRWDGHFTFMTGDADGWLLTDGGSMSGPGDPGRIFPVLLYEMATDRLLRVADFHLPDQYSGPTRVDLHPATSRTGRYACVDAAPEPGRGRQLYLLDLTSVIA